MRWLIAGTRGDPFGDTIEVYSACFVAKYANAANKEPQHRARIISVRVKTEGLVIAIAIIFRMGKRGNCGCNEAINRTAPPKEKYHLRLYMKPNPGIKKFSTIATSG